jgi:hypothetical protein
MEAGCSSAPELFLDGFCLTDKRGKWYKESDLLRYVDATDLQNLLT